uniref:Protein kinase domain-containing protein n=1 Tax=Cucumis melo TaxID=3656 RepID=A0A9I9CDQ5_CUCME
MSRGSLDKYISHKGPQTNNDKLDWNTLYRIVIGTVGFIAPELIFRNIGNVSHKSDVYSYGMLVLEMVGARKNPNDGVGQNGYIILSHKVK